MRKFRNMAKRNAGLIGGKKVITPYSPSGIWTLQDAQQEKGAANWNTPDGSTEILAARSAYYLKTVIGQNTNGYYWIKPTGASYARQVWCDMTTSGGGWMLMSYCGAAHTSGTHVKDAYTGSAFNASSSTLSASNGTSGTAANLGQEFINFCVVAGRGRGVASFRMAGTTNYYFTVNSTASWLPLIDRSTSQPSAGAITFNTTNRARAGNDWLKTTYTGYSADSANYNTGTLSSPSVMGLDGWNTLPGNFSVLAANWGYSISQYYQTDGITEANYSTWPSSHHSGWSSSGYFWLKIGSE
jgi:hypothetical protein